ncbi:RUN domain-containing protein [Cavenderia fasciculata]|uniref:RUN domain-containing protein n=1 Tax=Cavenderia fasciculata TaxID=261658 RepID=F4PGY6_CACFS|nr:RUN domain-containing protein [Cavenderia fasciculata]EGG24970.1 RUN domain-containing protein [Cavenderia fasciculata]|eukprot:XP_004362821.1 RUN domain-containing protein [Cavenderia fasciculata]
MITDRGLPQLLSDLNGFIQILLTSTASKAVDLSASPSSGGAPLSPTIIEDQNPHLLKICLYVEKILSEGLKDVNFIGKTCFFDVLEHLPSCLPDTSRVIELAKDSCKTAMGRGRVVIRQALNEGALEIYLSALCYNQSIVKSYYKETAFLRNSEFSSTFLTLLQSLEHIQFGLVVRDRDMDKPNYWDEITFTLLRSQPPPTPIKIQKVETTQDNTENEPNIDIQQQQQQQQEADQIDQQKEEDKEDTEHKMIRNNSGELDINSLSNVLDEINNEEKEKLSNQIIQANQANWNSMLDSLSRCSKSVLLDYGGKGSPITLQDKCIDNFFTIFDQIISSDLLTSVLNRWVCIERLCEGHLEVQQVQQVYSTSSTTHHSQTSSVLDTRVKAWIYKLLNQGKLTEVLKYRFTYDTLLTLLYNPNSIFHSHQHRLQIIDTISNLESKVIFHLAWDKLEVHQPVIVTKKIKIIKKKIRKVKSLSDVATNDKDDDVVSTITTTSDQLVDSSATSTPSIIDTTVEEKISTSPPPPPSHLPPTFSSASSSTTDIYSQKNNTSTNSLATMTNNNNSFDEDENPFLNNIQQKRIDSLKAEENNNNNMVSNQSFESLIIENTINSLSDDETIDKKDDDNSKTTNLSSFDETLAELFKKQRMESSSSTINLNQLEQSIENINNDSDNNNAVTKAIPRSSLLSNSHIGDYLSNLVQDDITPPRSRSSSRSSMSNPITIGNSTNNIVQNGNSYGQLGGSTNSNNRYRSNSHFSANGGGGGSASSSRKSSNAGNLQPDTGNWNEDGAFTNYYRPSTNGHEKEAFITPTYIPNNPYLSEALRRVDKEKEDHADRMSTSVDSFANYHMFNDYYGENSPTPSSIKEKKNRYAGEDNQIFITKDFKKPLLSASETSAKFCPGCFNKCDWYCTTCHQNDKMILPSRIVNHWDFKVYPICTQAKLYITQHYSIPVDIFICNPKVYELSLPLGKLLEIRKKLHFIGEYIETCRNKTSLEGLCKNREYFVTENVHLYSLDDLEYCFAGHLLPQIETLIEKYIHHVTITCITCKGKGYICEFCNSDKPIFSWMILDKQNIVQCSKCHSLSHKKCWIEDHCPKCIRIAKIKGKHNNNSDLNNNNNNSNNNSQNNQNYEDDANFYTGNNLNNSNNNNHNNNNGNFRYSMNKPY